MESRARKEAVSIWERISSRGKDKKWKPEGLRKKMGTQRVCALRGKEGSAYCLASVKVGLSRRLASTDAGSTSAPFED